MPKEESFSEVFSQRRRVDFGHRDKLYTPETSSLFNLFRTLSFSILKAPTKPEVFKTRLDGALRNLV